MRDPTAELLAAMAADDLHPKQIIWDSSFHRFPGVGQKGRGDNGYVKAYLDQRGAIYGDNRTKLFRKWQMEGLAKLTAEERQEFKRKQDEAAKQRRKDAIAAQKRVDALWDRGKPCENHPYLERRGIKDVPMKAVSGPLASVPDSDTGEPILMIPMYSVDQKLENIQNIWPDGTRKQMKGVQKTGLFNTIGLAVAASSKTKRIRVCEGFMTGWSIHLATEGTVAVAFFDGGLKTVAMALREKYPDAEIIICADNDRWSKVWRGKKKVWNPGVLAAREAAKAANAELCIPDFKDLSDVAPGEKGPTDFDDLRQREGLDAVREWLDPAKADQADTKCPPLPNETVAEGEDGDQEDDYPPREYSPRAEHPDLEERYRSDPTAIAHRLLDRMAPDILIVRKDDGGDTTALMRLQSGLWTNSPEPWRKEIGREADDILLGIGSSLATKKLTARAASSIGNRVYRLLANLDSVESKVRKVAATAWGLWMKPYQETGNLSRPRRAADSELDAQLRYMGCANGVVDLHTAKLLDHVAAADKLVTHSTGVAYNPKADSSLAERLFAHLNDEFKVFWVNALAWSLRGHPSRRIWLVVGPRNSGKTTVAEAVRAALGPYSGDLQNDALVRTRGDTAHRGIATFGPPSRIVTASEIATGRLDTALLKLLSGGGEFTTRKLYKDPITLRATASLFIFANPGKSVPRLGLADPALADRVRELPYPEVPRDSRDPSLLAETIYTTPFKEAVLAYLIEAGASLSGPPAAPEMVRQATQLRIELDLSPIEEFGKKFVQDSTSELATADVWQAWCDFQGQEVPNETSVTVEGFTRQRLNMDLKKRIVGLPNATDRRINGTKNKVWKGWKLE